MAGTYPIKLDVDKVGRRLIYDGTRRKWLVLTPEEWIRQNFIKNLVENYGYPLSRIANEVSLTVDGVPRRCDSIVYDDNLRPALVVEYKEPGVAVTQKVFDQIARYNLTLRASFLVVTNGRDTYCCRFHPDSGSYSFIPSIPSWPLPEMSL